MNMTAVAIAESVRTGSSPATAAVERSLACIAERDGEIGAFRRVRADAAMAEAERLAARPDLDRLPLAGVPIAIKDNVAVAGESLRDGSAGTSEQPAAVDHPVVARLRAAGAVVVGLTNVPELCLWGTCDSSFGISRNPWALGRTPGGSSGGSAAAVASDMVPIAHGNDGLGSIRIPAANCGLFGFRPGRDVVPAELGENAWFGMSENGPLTTTVADAALMLSVLAGRPELAAPAPAPGLRIALAPESPSPVIGVDPAWSGALNRAGAVLSEAGHTVTSARLPYPRNLAPLFERWTAGAAADARGLDRNLLAPRTRRHVAIGRLVERLHLVNPGQLVGLEARVREFFADHDVVLTPTLARFAPEAARWSERSWLSNMVVNLRYAPFPALWNLLGWPAASVPAGVDPGTGLPVAVQVAALPGSEATLLAVAAQLEASMPWQRVAPGYRD